MSEIGSIIKLHQHNNFPVLEKITDNEGKLFYNNNPIYISISKEEHNAIVKKDDGIFVDNKNYLNDEQFQTLTKITFVNGDLKFDNKVISWDYTKDQITRTNLNIWDVLKKEFPEL